MLKIIAFILCPFILSGCLANVNQGNVIRTASSLVQAASINDQELSQLSSKMRASEDRKYRVAPPNSQYTIRLNRIMANLKSVNGIPLTYTVYITNEVNANAAADGSVRVYSGIMDRMNDDELRFVLGHEIGHVADEHTKKKLRTAYTAAAIRNAAGIYAPVGQLTNSAIGNIAEKFVNAQYSQAQELDADAYGIQFMLDNGYNPNAALTCMAKLQGSGGFFSTHPSSQKRINELQKRINKHMKGTKHN